MKLATLMLADQASVREGTLGVLGGFINQMWRTEFPDLLAAQLVAVLRTTPEEVVSGVASASFRFWLEEEDAHEPLFEATGEFAPGPGSGREGFFPMVFNISNVEIPAPGKYYIYFEVVGQPVESVAFYVDLIPPQEV